MGKLIKLKRFNSITETELAKNLLKSHNIQAQVSNSGIEFPGDRGDAFGADLLVQEEDFEKAKEILENSNKIYKTNPMPNQQPNLEQQFNQPSPPIIPSPKPKFNLKYILIVAILAAIVGGGVLTYQYWWLPRHEIKPPNIFIKTPQQVVLEFYRCYLNARLKPIETLEFALGKCDNDNLEKNYSQRLLESERLREYFPVDPLTLASDDVEYNPQIDSVEIGTTVASVIVTLSPKDAPDHKLKVSLLLINSEWKIIEVEMDETADWQVYRNEGVGIEFKYPKFWGEVKEYRIKGPTECEPWERIVSGTEIRLTFSENYFTTLYFTSPDYKSAICFADREEVMPGFTKEEELTCEPYPIGISRVFECSRSFIVNSPAITWYNAMEDVQACGYDIDRHIKLISPNQNFPGLHIITFTPGSGYDTGCNEEKHYGPDITLEEFGNLRMRQLKENQLPFEARQFLWEFDNFIKSIKFIK